MKRLWCNADTELIQYSLQSSQIFVRKCLFSIYAHVLCWHKVFSILLQFLFPYPSAILALNYGIIGSYVDCTVSFLGCYEVEKRIDKSKECLDLG